jgi:urease accessory protein
MAADIRWLSYLLQTADTLFPTGAYAHSLGFEEIVRLGFVTNERTLGRYLSLQVIPPLAQQELPYLRYAFNAAEADDLKLICELDHEINAWKPAKETRDASVQLGTRRLRALTVISDNPFLRVYDECVEDKRAAGHHVVTCAIQAVIESVPLEAALHAYTYQTLASVCSAALKLIRIGQESCQRTLRAATVEGAAAIRQSLTVEREHAGWFNPVLEIASMRHERADERLFIS